jgi:uncharacterized damage-inducible protein DinB
MIYPELMIKLIQRTYDVLKQQTEDLTHEDSLLQPPNENCLNWVLGHIIQGRNRILLMMGTEGVWTEAEVALYKRDSPPITPENADTALRFERLLSDLDQSQVMMVNALRQKTLEDMDEMRGERSLGEWLGYFVFHESYHTGQTSQLRQLAGKNDKVL